jgi:RimJ/RimL family protein N-acetyltransferase
MLSDDVCALRLPVAADAEDLRRASSIRSRTDRTGRGLATAATRLVAHQGLIELGFQRLEIVMAVDNVASRRVAERAGATFEGTLRARLCLHGQYHHAHMYSIVSPSPSSERGSDR